MKKHNSSYDEDLHNSDPPTDSETECDDIIIDESELMDHIRVNFDMIKHKLQKGKFVNGEFLVNMGKSDFKKYGFKQPNHYRLLYQQTVKLIARYPINANTNNRWIFGPIKK